MPDHKAIEERLKKAREALDCIHNEAEVDSPLTPFGEEIYEFVRHSLNDLESLLAELAQQKAPLPDYKQKVMDEATDALNRLAPCFGNQSDSWVKSMRAALTLLERTLRENAEMKREIREDKEFQVMRDYAKKLERENAELKRQLEAK